MFSVLRFSLHQHRGKSAILSDSERKVVQKMEAILAKLLLPDNDVIKQVLVYLDRVGVFLH
jgi:hypothetical protein